MAGAHGLWHKQLFYEESVRIPLIFRGPGIPEGEICDVLASLIDLYPTLCDAAGLPVPKHCAGMSLLPAMLGKANEEERAVFSEIAWRPEGRGCMIRRGAWKYCRYMDGTEELYHLGEDPLEMNNLAALDSIKEMKADLCRVLLEFWQPDDLDRRINSRPKTPSKGAHRVAMQYCLADGTWVDAWP
jgi:choline-sulfatase